MSPKITRRLAAIIAFSGGVSGCKDPVRVNPPRLEIDPNTASLLVGDGLQFGATLTAGDGIVVSNPTVTWASSDSLVATVTSSGQVTARDVGTAVITASSASAKASVTIRVLAMLDCTSGGNIHAGFVGDETWRASASPHFVKDTIQVTGTLTIEPGGLVYGCANAALIAAASGQIIAEGSADRPITFRAADPSAGWHGINAGLGLIEGGLVTLKFSKVEAGDISTSLGHVTIEDSWLKNSNVRGFIAIRRSVVDSGSVNLFGRAEPANRAVFEETTVRGGSLTLTRTGFYWGPIAVNGGRIENSPGIAFSTSPRDRSDGGPEVTSTKPLRIVGSRGYPVDIPLRTFKTIWPTVEAQDSLLGNLNDTLMIGTGGSSATIRRDLPWITTCYVLSCAFVVDTLTIEPGGTLRLSSIDQSNALKVTARLNAVGTASLPIQFIGQSRGIELTGTGNSEIRHAVLNETSVTARDQHTIVLANITTNHYVNLASPGSTITNSELFDVAWLGATAALHLGAAGVRAERVIVRGTSGNEGFTNAMPRAGIRISVSDVQLLQCEVTDNASDGVRVVAGTNVRINECNIERNGGFGLNNSGAARVDARRNWWGDPVGPLGPNGDGVSGDVDYSEHRTTPIPPLVFRMR